MTRNLIPNIDPWEASQSELDEKYGIYYSTFCKWGIYYSNRSVLDVFEEGQSITEEFFCDPELIHTNECLKIPTRIEGYSQLIITYFFIALACVICLSHIIYSKKLV